jgi:hypothetical protein
LVRVTVFLSDAGYLFMRGRHCVSTAEDSKFSVRGWIADAWCSCGGDVVHITGACIIPLSLTRDLTPLTADPDNALETIFPDRYVGKWLQFQSLCDLEAEYVFNLLGEDLTHWQQLLTEIKKARSTFDASETQRSFGMCVIDCEQGAGAGEGQV